MTVGPYEVAHRDRLARIIDSVRHALDDPTERLDPMACADSTIAERAARIRRERDEARAELQEIRDVIATAGLVHSEHPSGSAVWAVRYVLRTNASTARTAAAEVGRRTAAEAEVERLGALVCGICVSETAPYQALEDEVKRLREGLADVRMHLDNLGHPDFVDELDAILEPDPVSPPAPDPSS